MADLSQLLQIAPTTGAGFLGINQRDQENESLLRQRELAELIQQRAMEAQHQQQMNPMKVQQQQLMNQGLQEGLPSITAKARGDTMAADAKARTFESDVETTISDNTSKRGKNAEDDRERATKFLVDQGAAMSQTPAPLRAKAFAEAVKQAGMNANNQQIQNMMLLAQQNPEGFPSAIQAYAERLGQMAETMSPAARSAKAVANINRSSAERIAEGNQKAMIESANIGAKSRLDVAAERRKEKARSLLEQAKTGGFKTYEAAAVNFRLLSDLAETTEEKEKYLGLAQEFEAAVKNKPVPGGKPDLEQLGIPTQQPVSAFGGGAGKPAPGKPQKHSLTEVTKMYPGVPPEKIKELYKKKFGVDLQ